MKTNIFITIVGALFVQNTSAAGINCKNITQKGDAAARIICQSKTLLDLDAKVADEYTKVRALMNFGNQQAFVLETQRGFVLTRNECLNQTDSQSPEKAITSCMVLAYENRLKSFARFFQNDEPLKGLTQDVRYFSPEFVKAYGVFLVDRDVFVFGKLTLDLGTDNPRRPLDPKLRLTGLLESESSPTKLLVQYKSMTEKDAEFLDYRTPVGYHRVTVKKLDNGLVLFVSSILGSPLP